MNATQAQQIVNETAKLYDQISDHFDLTRIHLWPEFDYFTPFLASGQSVLDVGCGNGRLVNLYEKIGLRYSGVDISAKLIERAQKNHPNSHFEVGSILDLSSQDGEFDVVSAIAVLQHIPRLLLDKAVAELASKVKPGGVLQMTNWNMWQKKFLKIRLQQFLQRLMNPSREIFGVPSNVLSNRDVMVFYQTGDKAPQFSRYLFALTPSLLKKLLQENGFEIVVNHFCSGNKKVSWWRAKNIVTVARLKGI